MHMLTKNPTKGFTIVELLIVVVVIAILAAITIVSYNGIANQAKEAAIKSNLRSVATKIVEFKTVNDSYPDDTIVDKFSSSANTTAYYPYGQDEYCVDASAEGYAGVFSVTEAGSIENGPCGTPFSASGGFTCALQNEQAKCWGSNAGGMLGTDVNYGIFPSVNPLPLAVKQGSVPSDAKLRQIITGFSSHACAVDTLGRAYCWGNDNGRLGNGQTGVGVATEPTTVVKGDIPSGAVIRAMTLGTYHTCALATDGWVYCFGMNTSSQIGQGTATGEFYSPRKVSRGEIPSNVTIRQQSAGGLHNCVLGSDNSIYCWGRGAEGQMGNGSFESKSTPVAIAKGAIPPNVTIRQVESAYFSSCALASDENIYCWGGNSSGQLGDGTTSNSNLPVKVLQGVIPSGTRLVSIGLGNGTGCALSTNAEVYCWGYNYYGELGDGTSVNKPAPVKVLKGAIPADAVIRRLSVGQMGACVSASDKSMYCWGTNRDGSIGNNATATRQTSPARVTGITF